MLYLGCSVLMRLFSSSSASASERTTVVSSRSNFADHVADARAAMVLLEVAGHPALEVARLAHVEQRILRIEVAVHPRQRGQRSHLGQEFFRNDIDMPHIVAAPQRRSSDVIPKATFFIACSAYPDKRYKPF